MQSNFSLGMAWDCKQNTGKRSILTFIVFQYVDSVSGNNRRWNYSFPTVITQYMYMYNDLSMVNVLLIQSISSISLKRLSILDKCFYFVLFCFILFTLLFVVFYLHFRRLYCGVEVLWTTEAYTGNKGKSKREVR